jgi:hypothetical protein
MVHVRVDRPVREDDVRLLRRDELRHRVDMCVGQFGRAIDLTEVARSRAEDPARRLRLGSANPRGVGERLPFDAALAAREVEDRHGVAGRRIAGERAAAAGFRIVGMPADADDRQSRRARLGTRR